MKKVEFLSWNPTFFVTFGFATKHQLHEKDTHIIGLPMYGQ